MAPNKRRYWDSNGTLWLLNKQTAHQTCDWWILVLPNKNPEFSAGIALAHLVWCCFAFGKDWRFLPHPDTASKCYWFIFVQQLWKQMAMSVINCWLKSIHGMKTEVNMLPEITKNSQNTQSMFREEMLFYSAQGVRRMISINQAHPWDALPDMYTQKLQSPT